MYIYMIRCIFVLRFPHRFYEMDLWCFRWFWCRYRINEGKINKKLRFKISWRLLGKVSKQTNKDMTAGAELKTTHLKTHLLQVVNRRKQCCAANCEQCFAANCEQCCTAPREQCCAASREQCCAAPVNNVVLPTVNNVMLPTVNNVVLPTVNNVVLHPVNNVVNKIVQSW